jgi:two-component system chemotaxis response regulator CheB
MSETVNVLIVDDSDMTREILRSLLESDPAIRVCGVAENGKQAIDLVQKLKPNMVIMDINMPVMDGFQATEQIMAYCPTPILILSSTLNKGGVYTTFNALAIGAVDVMEKPAMTPNASWSEIGSSLIRKVKLVSQAKVLTHLKGKLRKVAPLPDSGSIGNLNNYELVCIGASTGGPSVVMRILKAIPPDYNAAVLVVQHMAAGFTENFVDWLGSSCKIKIKLAEEGEKIEKGKVLVAPDGFHTIVSKRKTIRLITSDAVNNVKPSVDVLFNSIAEEYGGHAMGVLLTGMGADGADGLKRIRESGSATIAQSEESCTVFGMPKVAIERGAAVEILSVEDIINTLLNVHPVVERRASSLYMEGLPKA